MAANSIKVVSKEQCYAKYDRDSLHEHLESRMNCIYRNLTWEFDELERELHIE